MRSSRTERYLLLALGISALLHLLTILYLGRYVVLETTSRRTLPGRPFLQRYELINPPVVSNPNARPEQGPPKEARMASDRSAVAANRAPKNLPRSDVPYSKGDMKEAYNPVSRGGGAPPAGGGGQGASRAGSSPPEGQLGRVEITPPERPGPDERARGRDFGSYLRGGEKRGRESEVYGRGISRIPLFDNEGSAVLREGDLSFNTYDWDFAPYMLKLKERIEAHIFPPAAFSLYGWIEGVNVVRFRISRSGGLLGVEILGYEGSQLLVETSTKAVELSNPFLPLPPSFPEQFLEVTGHFRYEIIRGAKG